MSSTKGRSDVHTPCTSRQKMALPTAAMPGTSDSSLRTSGAAPPNMPECSSVASASTVTSIRVAPASLSVVRVWSDGSAEASVVGM